MAEQWRGREHPFGRQESAAKAPEHSPGSGDPGVTAEPDSVQALDDLIKQLARRRDELAEGLAKSTAPEGPIEPPPAAEPPPPTESPPPPPNPVLPAYLTTGIRPSYRGPWDRTTKPMWPTAQELAVFLEAVPPEMRTVLELRLASGLTFDEIAALRWSDIDFEAGVIRVKVVRLTEAMREALSHVPRNPADPHVARSRVDRNEMDSLKERLGARWIALPVPTPERADPTKDQDDR